MRFTYNWLKEYVGINLKPQELAEKLTMAGLEIESLEKIDGDWVFEAEVTTNRPDWLSMLGIAREAAAITGAKIIPLTPSLSPMGRGIKGEGVHNAEHPPADSTKTELSIDIEDKLACPRYTGRIISDVKVGPSPDWLKKRLQSVGLRPINNIVDITNFVLFETGQPLHAFDLDKIDAQMPSRPEAQTKIIVRRAKDGEEIVTIDGLKRILNKDILVVASGSGKLGNWETGKPLAIAGIMGGKETEVTEATKNILLESAYFNPAIIRRASKSLGLSTDSSYRFERNVDYTAVKTASGRAVELIFKIAAGKADKLVDIGKRPEPPAKVLLRPVKANSLLGTEIPPKVMVNILKSLGLRLVSSSKAKIAFSVPSWRSDLKKEVDLIEEIIRIYGYDKAVAVQPKDIDVKDRVFLPKRLEFEAIVRDTLIGFGLNEALTYSLVDKNIDQLFEAGPDESVICVKNPLSPELAVLRRNLTQGVLSAARWNLNRNISDIKLFEIGPVYSLKAIGELEEDYLAICLSGNRTDNWQDGPRPADFYYLKGVVEALFNKLGVKHWDVELSENRILAPSQSAKINVNAETIGFLGKIKKELLSKIDIEKDCFVCQISLDGLFKHVNLVRKFSSLAKFPAVYRDISTLAKQEVLSGRITAVIEQVSGGLVKDAKLFDVYRGEQIPKGYKSLVYRLTYQSPDKTLTDKEVDAVHSSIVAALKDQLGVQIR